MVRMGVAALVLAWLADPATAEPLEASGFVGVVGFGNTELGNSWAPEQVPGTAPVAGGRVGWLPLRDGMFTAGLEAELSLASAFTGGTTFVGRGGRMSYFAPVFGWRAHAIVRANRWLVRPHLVVGAGGETVASSSPFMSKETDPVVYWGPGATLAVTDRWQLRLDLRHGIMPARDTGATSTFELQFGIAMTFGPPRAKVRRHEEPPTEEVMVADDRDADGDGLPDRLDRCPDQAETVNGVADDDGCAEADGDGDGVIGTADRCPDQAEDFDKLTDEDGCPDPDNDADGIEDVRDACAGEPETRNGIDDTDGCPDLVPADVTKALAGIAAQKFERDRARLTNPIKTTLEPVLALLGARASLHLAIVGHATKGVTEELAKRRAEAVKWYLVDQGFAEDRISTRLGETAGTPITIELVPR